MSRDRRPLTEAERRALRAAIDARTRATTRTAPPARPSTLPERCFKLEGGDPLLALDLGVTVHKALRELRDQGSESSSG